MFSCYSVLPYVLDLLARDVKSGWECASIQLRKRFLLDHTPDVGWKGSLEHPQPLFDVHSSLLDLNKHCYEFSLYFRIINFLFLDQHNPWRNVRTGDTASWHLSIENKILDVCSLWSLRNKMIWATLLSINNDNSILSKPTEPSSCR
jgi:hypothetical protein